MAVGASHATPYNKQKCLDPRLNGARHHQQRGASFGTLRYPLGTRPSRHRFGAGGRVDVGGDGMAAGTTTRTNEYV